MTTIHKDVHRILFVLLLFVVPVSAQMQTLMPKSVTHGVYIAPLLSSSRMGPDREFGVSPGLQAGWILKS